VLPVIEKLEEMHEEKRIELVGVVSQPARPSGRKQVLTDPPVAAYAKQQGLTVLQPEKARDPEFLAQFAALEPDIAITAAYGQILSEAFLTIPKRATFNLHPSLLPAYRGATPVPAALLDGVKETGISLLFTVRALDAGNLITQQKTQVGPLETADVLMRRLFECGAELLPKAFELLCDPHFQGMPQDPERVTHCKRFSKLDGGVDWKSDAETIERRFRAFYPWPGAFAQWNGKRVLFHHLFVAQAASTGKTPGSFTYDKPSQCLLIETGKGVLMCNSLQLEGAKACSATSFWNGAAQQGPHYFTLSPILQNAAASVSASGSAL
jgi:methionyl-tRNA formyltransferase